MTTTQIQTWEYKNIRFDYKGRGITQEFNILDVDGERRAGWIFKGLKIMRLPEMLNALTTRLLSMKR